MAKIVVENITKVFNKRSRNANRVLKGVSFELPDKGLVAIFGKSGSGKTTLLNIIGGLDRQDGGKVFIDGECTSGKADKIRNSDIGFIFQNYYLESGYSISEILRNQMKIAGFKDEAEIKRRCEEALKLVDMERFKNKRGDALSGGQKQRVAIARALVKGADIILADEPTGNLDAENTVKVMDILKEISKTKLVVLVTHEITLIKRYADSHIKIVDGQLVEDGEIADGELAAETYGNFGGSVGADKRALATFTRSTSKRNGNLFTFGSVLRALRGDGEEKAYSTGNIFKQIFILAMAVVLCFLSYSVFEALGTKIENKELNEYSVYTNLNAYDELAFLALQYPDAYEYVDFFETELREGAFSYNNVASLSGFKENYIPKAISAADGLGELYGSMPEEGEVLISRELAERLKADLRLNTLRNDRSLLLMQFESEYRISGIVGGDEPVVYMNKVDYVNFLGVYSDTGFTDNEGIFFTEDYISNYFSTEIRVADESAQLSDNQVVVEISRNSLYGMMADTTQADYIVQAANKQLALKTTAVSVSGSTMYVKSFQITRGVMTTDIIIYVSQNVLDNIFVKLPPNLDAISSSEGSSSTAQYFFEVNAQSGEQLSNLKTRLRERGISTVNISAIYERANDEIMQTAMQTLGLFAIAAVLLFLIYFFIEKSASIKNSKQYGVYRAIGVNRGNLIFKEFVTAFTGNIISYFIFFCITALLIAVRYAIMNAAYAGFIGLAAATFAVSAVLLLGISLIPYLFVIWQKPAKILSKYDI